MTITCRETEHVRMSTSTRDINWHDLLWLGAISSTLLLTLLPFSSYIASIPFVRDEWGMSNSEAAVVFSAYLVGYAASSVLLLPVTDRLPAGRILFASVAVIAVSNLLFPLLARDVASASVLRFAAGAGHVGAYIPGIRLVSLRFAERRRATAVSIFVGAGYAGTTVSYVFMGQLLSAVDTWRTAYLITALVGLVGVVVALLLVREGGPEGGPAARAPARLDLSILRHRPMLLINVGYALHTAELYLARLWLPLLLAAAFLHPDMTLMPSAGETSISQGEAAALAATWSGFMFMTGIGGVFFGGAVSDRFGRTVGAGGIFAVSGLLSFVVGWMIGFPVWLIIGIGFVYGFATAADSAIYSTAVTELAPPSLIGSTQAVQSFVGFLVGAAAPIVAGSILDLFQDDSGWGLAFGFNGVLAVIGVMALILLRRLPEASRMAGGKK